jgi:hypothetical protein
VAQVTLYREEWERGLLPDVCAVCGEYGDRKLVEFAWVSSIPLPVCDTHRHYARLRESVAAVWATALLILFVAAVVWVGLGWRRSEIGWWILLTTPLIGLIGIVFWEVWKRVSIRASRYDGRIAKLRGVSPLFVSALEAVRDRLEADLARRFNRH